MTDAAFERTAPLLRPHEVESRKDEAVEIEKIFNSPAHVQSQIQNKGQLRRRLSFIHQELEQSAPKKYGKEDLDLAKKRHDALLEDIQQGMPTQEEMRRRPAGAVDKYRAWTKRNKEKILEWKNIRLRLHASGDLPESNIDAQDVANLERFRPAGGSQELNMHGELIEGKQFHQRPPGADQVVVMSDAVSDFLREHDIDLHRRMAALSNSERRLVIDRVEVVMADYLVEKLKSDKLAPARAAKAEKRMAKEAEKTEA